jgi:predicted DNA binding CopG/RHH family protein
VRRKGLTEIEKEFADFVEGHDTAEMIRKGELEEVEEIEIAIPPKKVPLTIRIYPALLERIKRIARKQGMPYQTLVNQWLAERVYFEEHTAEK